MSAFDLHGSTGLLDTVEDHVSESLRDHLRVDGCVTGQCTVYSLDVASGNAEITSIGTHVVVRIQATLSSNSSRSPQWGCSR